MSRHEFSKKTKAEAFQRCGGFCEGKDCGVKIYASGFHYDHVNPDWFSGSNDLDNCQVLCLKCHKQKTSKEDRPDIAKAKRRWEKERNILRPKRSWGYGKKDRLKKKINGEVVER